jgi:hypothetical protein
VEGLSSCAQRRVLRLTSSCCLFRIRDPVRNRFQFEDLNLSKLKELKLVGFNYDKLDGLLGLSINYLSALNYCIWNISSGSLTRLELLMDGSDDYQAEVGNVASQHKGIIRYRFSQVLRAVTLRSNNESFEPRARTIRNDNDS